MASCLLSLHRLVAIAPAAGCCLSLTVLATLGHGPALGQDAPPTPVSPTPPNQGHRHPLIHVNPVSGSDTAGNGSQLRPYQTITQALATAPSQSIVLLAPGDYSEASGETFPIRLKPGVTVQGTPGIGSQSAVIRGSGIWSSSTQTTLHVTVVGIDGAGLGHVTVTNPSTAGYGLVVETGQPLIRSNTFLGSGYGGALISGDSAPVFEGNRFTDNGVVGLAIAGQSTAVVQGNQFDNTGIGIRIAPGAHPQIYNNRIVQNQDGIILDGSAQPQLHNNVIAHNRRNGVVEFQTAAKADGTVTAMAPPAALRPGTTPAVFTGEAPSILAASAPIPAIAAPSIASPPPTPSRDLPLADDSPPAQSPQPAASSPTAAPGAQSTIAVAPTPEHAPPESAAPESAARESTLPESAPLLAPSATSTPEPAPPQAPNQAPEPAPDPAPLPDLPATAPRLAAAPITEPPPATPDSAAPATAPLTEPPPAARPRQDPSGEQLAAIHRHLRQQRQAAASQSAPSAPPESEPDSGAVPLEVIPPPTETIAAASPTPEEQSPPEPKPDEDTQLLRVPSRSIPSNHSGQLPALRSAPQAPNAATGDGPPPPPPSLAGLLGLNYKVLVPAADPAIQDQVRAVVSDAFRVRMNGQMMMQAGAYPDPETAEATANRLRDQGLSAQVEYVP